MPTKRPGPWNRDRARAVVLSLLFHLFRDHGRARGLSPAQVVNTRGHRDHDRAHDEAESDPFHSRDRSAHAQGRDRDRERGCAPAERGAQYVLALAAKNHGPEEARGLTQIPTPIGNDGQRARPALPQAGPERGSGARTGFVPTAARVTARAWSGNEQPARVQGRSLNAPYRWQAHGVAAQVQGPRPRDRPA